MQHGARQHARYGGSVAHRVLGCPGHIRYCATLPPREQGDAAEWGERAHELLERCLLAGKERVPAGWCGDTEMAEAVEVVLDYITNLIISRPGNRIVVRPEVEVTFPQNIVPPAEAGGIIDVMVVDETANEAWMIDAKFGYVTVEAPGNAQLLFYSTAAFWTRCPETIHLVIAQPRAPHREGRIREWAIDGVALVEFHGDMEAAIRAAERGDADTKAGSWCRYCAAEAVCPAREAAALVPTGVGTAAALRDFAPGAPHAYPVDRLAWILQHEEALTSYLRAVRQAAHAKAMSGIVVPGYKLVQAVDRRRFNETDPDALALALSALTGFEVPEEDFKARKLPTIEQVERRLKEWAKDGAPRGKQREAITKAMEQLAFLMTKDTSGNLVLVSQDDSRPAADRVATGFAGVNIPPPPSKD